ncbi:vitronectin [Pelobates cultripes]|uniref:Vitronectin n=1 Tax=Pelobates cultripes TaxID=61616 RepID=A0AAD1VKW2_PELCU|nr:vitronectin [Pelobates cultripes]
MLFADSHHYLIEHGKNYWRFTDGVLDPKYPLEISDGFSNIPDDVDAAFALPANNYNDKEKVYFFKGSKYWQYEFKNQPSWEECLESTPSEIFTRYLRVQDDSLESFFELLFGSWEKKKIRPSYIRSDWRGVPINVDAVLPSRIYFPVQTRSSTRRNKRRKSRRRKNRKRRPSKKSSWYDDLFSLFDADDDDDVESDPDWLPPVSQPRCQPIQSVYFFKNDKYYRVNLQRKSVDMVYPRYPRSIGKPFLLILLLYVCAPSAPSSSFLTLSAPSTLPLCCFTFQLLADPSCSFLYIYRLLPPQIYGLLPPSPNLWAAAPKSKGCCPPKSMGCCPPPQIYGLLPPNLKAAAPEI